MEPGACKDPATVERDEDVGFRDVPDALASGETLDEVLTEAVDGLVVALDGYADERRARPIPRPSHSRPREYSVAGVVDSLPSGAGIRGIPAWK